MNLFDLSLKLNGFPIAKAKSRLAALQQLSASEFGRFVEDQKKQIVQYHLAQTPFYKHLVKSNTFSSWQEVPIMSKRDLQQPLKSRLSKEFSTKNSYIDKTSGSSGDPFIFAKDKFCHALTWSIIQNRFGWFDIDFNSSLQARFYGIPLDKKGYYKERIKDALGKRFRFSVYDLGDAAFDGFVNKFAATSFQYINGYTSTIVLFAKYLEREGRVLNTICPTLKVCVVTSEMLFEDDKMLMEKWFGIPVVNEYGASELDVIAFQNPTGHWMVNSETLYVEIVDEHDRVLPYGKEGRIVVTSLFNKAHPFIRYDIGDIGILSEESTLQNPRLEKLIGRTNDIAILPSGRKAAGLTFYYITKSIMEDDGNVKEFVIEQRDLGSFKVTYVSEEPLTDKQIKDITEEMERYLEKGLHLVFERQPFLKRSKSGKLKQFTSLISHA